MTGRRFGFECEVVGGTADLLRILHDDGILSDDDLHDYHCDCSYCDAETGSLMHAQRDCTVDGEFITRILRHGTAEADRVITSLASAHLRARTVVDTDAGFHVHVDRNDLTEGEQVRVVRLFARYQEELRDLAAAKERGVRGYNAPLNVSHFPMEWWTASDNDIANGALLGVALTAADRDYFLSAGRPIPATYGPVVSSGWLRVAPYGTFEFRLWNATTAEWRMRLAIGMSVAIVDAAKDGVNVGPFDPRTLEEVVGPYMDDGAWAGVLRQRFSKGGFDPNMGVPA